MEKENIWKKIKCDDKSGRVRARLTYTLPNGEKKRFEVTGSGVREAKNKLIEKIEMACNQITYAVDYDSNLKISEAVMNLIDSRANEYDHTLRRIKRRPETIARDKDCYKSLIQPFDISEIHLDDITVPDIEKYMHQLRNAKHDDKYYSSSSLNRAMRLVKAVLDDYYRHSERKSPSDAIIFLPVRAPKKTEKDFCIGEEFENLLFLFVDKSNDSKYLLDATYASLFLVMMYTGLRLGEGSGLQCKNWDSTTQVLTIDHTGVYADRTKTEDSKSSLILCDEAAQILNRYTKGKSPEDLIFPNTLGELLSSSNARRKFKRWVKECGIEKDLHPHSLRGSYGVYLMDNGMELSAVSRNLRHAKVDTTAKYYSTYTASQRIKDQTAANQIFANISRH